MRVTTFGASAQYLNNLNSVMGKYQNLEQELATGRSLNQPSDNPVAMSEDITIQSSETLTSQWNNNAGAALSKMQTADGVMGQLQTVLGNIRTQLIQAMNGTNTPQDLQSIGANVFQEVNSVVQLANTNDGESYIFAGTSGKNQPLAITVAANNQIAALTWTGAAAQQSVEIGNNVTLAVSVNGSQLFNTSPGGGQPTLLQTLQAINNDLNSGNTANLSTDLAQLDTNLDNVSAMRADLGGRMNRAQAAQAQMATMTKTLQTEQGQVEDANMAEVATQLVTQQTIYQAALQSGQNLILPTLADVLKS